MVTRPPPAFDVDLGTVDLLHGAASRRVTIDGVRVEDVMRLELPVGTVEADAFPRIAEQIRVIDDAFLHGIEVQLPR